MQKKLVYLYLANYAESNADVALLVVNTLQRNAADVDPMIRGLALRTLCSLRLANLAEYTIPVLSACLGDASPYVRRTAAVGVAKVAAVAPHAVDSAGLVATLRLMVKDKEAGVVLAAISALHEIAAPQGGVTVDEGMVLYLFNRLRDFDDWGQATILELCKGYSPTSEEQRAALLNILDARLSNLNAAVVMAAVAMFISLTEHDPVMYGHVLLRIKAPLITLLSRAPPEMAYAVVHHCRLLAERDPALFADEFTSFYVLYSDPAYLVDLKLQMLRLIASPDNAKAIVSELAEYVTDVNETTSRAALGVLGAIGLELQPAAKHVLTALFGFLSSQTQYVLDGTVVVMKDLVRKYSDLAPHLLDQVPAILPRLVDPAARTVLIWLIGEHGSHLDQAPYMLEDLVSEFEAESSAAVKLQLLTSSMQLFLARPGEMQPILGSLLAMATADNSIADVHDRALFYYRLLEEGVDDARTVLSAPKLYVESFAEADTSELVDALFEEFNSLAITYRRPSQAFIHQRAPYVLGKTRFGGDPSKYDDIDEEFGGSSGDADYADADYADDYNNQQPPPPTPTPTPTTPTPDLTPTNPKNLTNLGIEDELTGAAVLEQSQFQELWMSFQGRGEEVDFPIQAPLTIAQVEETLARFRIVCMASGAVQPTLFKFFFYGQTHSNHFILMQLIIDTASMSGSAVVKTQAKIMTKFVSTVVNVLSAASMRAAAAAAASSPTPSLI